MIPLELDSFEGYTLFTLLVLVIVVVFYILFEIQAQSPSQSMTMITQQIEERPESSILVGAQALTMTMPRVSSISSIVDEEDAPLNLTIAFRNDKRGGSSYGAITRFDTSNLLALEEEYLYREYQEIRGEHLSAGGEASAHTPVDRTTTEGGDFSFETTTNSPSAIDLFSMGHMTPLEMEEGSTGALLSPAAVLVNGTRRDQSSASAASAETSGSHSNNSSSGGSWRGRLSTGDGFLSRGVLRLLKRPFRRDKDKGNSDKTTMIIDI